MMTIIVTLIYCLIFGIGIGGFLLTNRNGVNQSHVILLTISFGAIVYLGMAVGNYFFSFATIRLIEVVFSMILFLFLIVAILKFEQYHGYFHVRSKELIWILFILFFLIGIEWVTLQLSYVMILIGTALFLCSLILGMAIQDKIMQIARNNQMNALVPIVWFLFIIMMRFF